MGQFSEFRCKPKQAAVSKLGPAGVPPPTADPSGGDAEINKPWSRTGATCCKQNDTFYLFGGVVNSTGRKSAELFVLSTDTMEWRLQDTAGDNMPVARSDHCAVIDPDTNRLIIFGGRSQVSCWAICMLSQAYVHEW